MARKVQNIMINSLLNRNVAAFIKLKPIRQYISQHIQTNFFFGKSYFFVTNYFYNILNLSSQKKVNAKYSFKIFIRFF